VQKEKKDNREKGCSQVKSHRGDRMNSQVFQMEAVVLKAVPFQENDRILTLFAPSGVFKLFLKGRGRDLIRLNALATPLTVGEYLFVQGRGELFRFREGTIHYQHLHLRSSLEKLQVAQQLIEALMTSQWPAKPSQQLYLLFRHFLYALERSAFPYRLIAPFLLKLLQHEGILQLKGGCVECGKRGVARFGGVVYCDAHTFLGAISMSLEEEGLLIALATSRSLQEILEAPQTEEWIQKVKVLFHQIFNVSGHGGSVSLKS
jgi:DNA repair protein RecO (recombination protein O)